MYICYLGTGCKAALLQASQKSAEAAFLYRVWDAIPNPKTFAYSYVLLLRGDFTPKGFKPESPHHEYVLAVYHERRGEREKAAGIYYKVCKRTEGLFAAENCYRAYRLGVKEAGEELLRRFPNTYYVYFLRGSG